MRAPRTGAAPLRRVVATAPGKVNLSLRVGAPDERGYHALATVFQALDLTETVEARASADGAISLAIDSHVAGDVPADATNLAVRAAELLRAEHGVTAGAALRITKRVPVAGGMAGGSADAAAALVALDRLWGLDLPDAELRRLGARLGADVPFALLGGTALGTGTGTSLEPLAAPAPLTWVLLAPGGELSTPAVFGMFDALAGELEVALEAQPAADQAQIEALASGDLEAIGTSLANGLEPAALRLRPELAAPLRALRGAGALGALVSGSGPTLAALARGRDHAARIIAASGVDPQRCTLAVGPAPGARVVEAD